ncbi:protein of unknown function [Candidatus Nitrosocosmicus franklandus]|uniref:Uncharacterized protein n=1 Tax=Candidatus Nitrosocosmicus franklandianus TaxID=1798806 RepID=A0A484ICC3_9ARCH|nr:protein of unknown function [Candidatus Nitrosocosmicus franklandus]
MSESLIGKEVITIVIITYSIVLINASNLDHNLYVNYYEYIGKYLLLLCY